MEENWYFLVAKIVAIPAFLISLWNLLAPYVLILRLKIIPESQIQVLKATIESNRLTGFNVLFTVFGQGPASKWNTYKFINAEVSIPDGRKLLFSCRAYLEEVGLGQSNASRNIPVAINGGQSKSTTAAFQSSEYTEWKTGAYSIHFNVFDSRGGRISSDKLNFTIDEKEIKIIEKLNSTLIKEADVRK